MENEGAQLPNRSNQRLGIPYRSCDQCRARKVGCDRSSPCTNCQAARLNCTHSTALPKPATKKERVLISTKYEQKIDEIAQGVVGINRLLKANQLQYNTVKIATGQDPDPTRRPPSATKQEGISWDHSRQVVDFVKAVVERGNTNGPQVHELFLPLKEFIAAQASSAEQQETKRESENVSSFAMPPQQDVMSVLKWAKCNPHNSRVGWLSRIMPLKDVGQVCQNVYFPVNEVKDLTISLANGLLSYLFAECAMHLNVPAYKDHSQVCRSNFGIGLARLGLFLPSSQETIVFLTLAALRCIEDSDSTAAWTLTSMAADLCERLGYHRLVLSLDTPATTDSARKRLYWAVYVLEKSLSLRLGRPSRIRDDELGLVFDNDDSRPFVARLQGMAFEQLFSSVALRETEEVRNERADFLASRVQELVEEKRKEIGACAAQLAQGDMQQTADGEYCDMVDLIQLQCDLVCRLSLLVLILRSKTIRRGYIDEIPVECLAVAREVLIAHHQCVVSVDAVKDKSIVRRYINWAILHLPFDAFNVIFTHTIQFLDYEDLDRMDRFVSSLQFEDASLESHSHPCRLYDILCRIARAHLESQIDSPPNITTFPAGGATAITGSDPEALAPSIEDLTSLDDWVTDSHSWYYQNQVMRGLLDGRLSQEIPD